MVWLALSAAACDRDAVGVAGGAAELATNPDSSTDAEDEPTSDATDGVGSLDTTSAGDAAESGDQHAADVDDAASGPTWTEPAWLTACAAGNTPTVQLTLSWSPFYKGETQARVSRGMLWLLHWLGATLPEGCEPKVVTWLDGRRFRLDTTTAGLPTRAACVLGHVADALAASEERAVMGGVDVGRFVALAIGVPSHYYAAVGMPTSVDGFRALHPEVGALFAVLPVSLVAFGPRRIEASSSSATTDGIAWLAAAVPDPAAPVPSDVEWEAIDTMPNGALRYAVYGHDGQLAAESNPSEGLAGKPSRCLWCHEGLLTRQLTDEDPLALPGALYRSALAARISADNALLRSRFAKGGRAVHPEVRDEHSQGELLYAGFLEPSATRLAIEWGLSRDAVLQRLEGLPVHHEAVFHVDSEEVYDRWQVDPLAPFAVVPAPRSIHFGIGPEPELVH